MIESDRVMETVKVEAQANKKFHDAIDEADSIGGKKIDADDKKTAAAGEG
jgi:hypothetical protein